MREARQTDAVLELGLLLCIRALVLLILLLVPLVVTTSTIYPYIVGKSLWGRGLIEVAFGLWLLLAWRYPAYRPPLSRLLQIFAIYMGIALLAGLFGVSLQRSLWSTYERMQGIVDLAHWLVFTVIVVSIFRSFLSWRYLLNVNLGVSVILGLLGLGQHWGITVPVFDVIQPTARLDITLGNPTYVGAYMLVNVFIGLGFLVHSFLQKPAPVRQPSRAVQRRRQRRGRSSAIDYTLIAFRVFWLAAVVLDLWIMIMSGTRGVVVGIGAGLLALAAGYMVLGGEKRLRLAAACVMGFMVAGSLAFLLVRDTEPFQKLAESNVMLQRVADTRLDDASLSGRLYSISAGLKGFAERPILGWGPENFHVAFGRYVVPSNRAFEKFDQAHSKLIEELTTKGALGFVGYMAIWVFMIWIVVRKARPRKLEDQAFRLFVGAALVGYFAQNLFLFDTPVMLLQFVLLVAFVAYLETTSEDSDVPVTVASGREANAGRRTWAAVVEDRLSPIRAWFRVSDGRNRPGGGATPGADARFVIGVAAVLALLGASLFFFNYRIYSAATLYVEANSGSLAWEEKLRLFDRSIDTFPQLANYPRLGLFASVMGDWQNLEDEDRRRAIAIVESEAEAAIEREPENWHIIVALANLYLAAASIDENYREEARSYVERATELAPGRLEVYVVRARQRLVEKDYEGALAIVDEFIELNEHGARRLGDIRAQILRASGQ